MKLATSALVLFSALQTAVAADPALLSSVVPDAKLVAGLNIDSTRNSQFGQYVLAHLPMEDQNFQDFIAQTGFDPRRDIHELVMSTNYRQNAPDGHWLVAASGSFDTTRIARAITAQGNTSQTFSGVTIYATTNAKSTGAPAGIAFLSPSSALMGDLTSLKAAIQRRQANTPVDSTLAGKVSSVSTNDFWFATLVPLSEFASAMPDPNMQGAMKGNLMQGISMASGGVRFGPTVNLVGEAVARSASDAQALVDVIRFVVGMIQQNGANNASAKPFTDVLDSLDLKTNGNIVTLALALPEQQLEQLLHMAANQSPRAARQPAPARRSLQQQ